MASDQKHTRRRTSSNAASLPIRSGQHAQKAPKAVIQPKSAHTSDDFLRDFLSPSFDAAAFLNATLPPLASKPTAAQAGTNDVALAELSAQTQTLLSQLNTQTTRLSDTLTQLTDEILRSGSRLAYEVELLRGETLSLSEMFNEKLREDIEVFVPAGLHADEKTKKDAPKKTASDDRDKTDVGEAALSGEAPKTSGTDTTNSHDPEYVQQLKTLTLVRSRLDSVIKTFGDAMDFTFPPSEVSVSSGFLSVSAPEPGSAEQSSEDKGQQVLRGLRDEISKLLHKSDDPVQGIEKAAARIEELKELTIVWRGTAEEKGRNAFIESLARMVEERHRDLMREMDQTAKKESRTANSSSAGKRQDGGEEGRGLGGFGLINQLQKLRNGL
ncbi:hypothetical protein QQS21_011133 [Conoideocrella luteorostrata]|uniref:Uncharacterized protein n=1 Tax=Conoideocrella luteorostrata TaxID=1105319 RepID=A0AAJ0FNU3_9HYPO|nr:hypothetical protein QQS21_011133 [Conoideocrella luteorostrata]